MSFLSIFVLSDRSLLSVRCNRESSEHSMLCCVITVCFLDLITVLSLFLVFSPFSSYPPPSTPTFTTFYSVFLCFQEAVDRVRAEGEEELRNLSEAMEGRLRERDRLWREILHSRGVAASPSSLSKRGKGVSPSPSASSLSSPSFKEGGRRSALSSLSFSRPSYSSPPLPAFRGSASPPVHAAGGWQPDALFGERERERGRERGREKPISMEELRAMVESPLPKRARSAALARPKVQQR